MSILLWWLADDERLPVAMRKVIAEPDRAVFVSAVSAWEMSIKAALGKLDVPEDLRQQLDDEGISELAVTVEDGLAAGALSRHHDDPFDRILIAQATAPGAAAGHRPRSAVRVPTGWPAGDFWVQATVVYARTGVRVRRLGGRSW